MLEEQKTKFVFAIHQFYICVCSEKEPSSTGRERIATVLSRLEKAPTRLSKNCKRIQKKADSTLEQNQVCWFQWSTVQVKS